METKMENILNTALRPLNLDVFAEKRGSWSDTTTYQWGVEYSGGQFQTLELWTGPFYLAISRTK